MTDRDAIRRELAAEIVAFADRKAWSHWESMEEAQRYEKPELADRCADLVSVWRQVEEELKVRYLSEDVNSSPGN